MGFISDVKKALGIGGNDRAANINRATDAAVDGTTTEDATLGNPSGTPKKKKLKPVSSRVRKSIPTTLRG
jgi:hypothetical protein